MRATTFTCVFVVCLLCGFSSLSGQVGNLGGLVGTVTDDSGYALPGVDATLSGDIDTRHALTNERGVFTFIGLRPGRYQLTLQLAGFRTYSGYVDITGGKTK